MAKTIPGDTPVLAAMRHYGADITREEYLSWCYPGEDFAEQSEGLPDDLPDETEADLPVQFQRATLMLDPESEKIQ
jgi:hypothetical protein